MDFWLQNTKGGDNSESGGRLRIGSKPTLDVTMLLPIFCPVLICGYMIGLFWASKLGKIKNTFLNI